MTRGRILFFLLSLLVVLPMTLSGVRRAAAAGQGDDSLYKQLSVFSEVLHLIRRAYVEEVTSEALLAGALDGASDALDPLSTFVPADGAERFATVRRVGSSRSGVTLAKERGIAMVVAVAPGSPAEEAGVRPRDVLAEIDGRSTRRTPLWQLRTLLAGEPGTELALTILRRGQEVESTITLGAWEAASVESSERQGAAVVRLRGGCRAETADELQEALAAARAAGRERLLLDLRGVAEGEPELAYGLAELFAGGELGSLRNRDGVVRTFSAGEPPLWSGAMVALIDRSTMGCGEILASVLRESTGAPLVGEPSFGHAGRRRSLPLSNGALLITTDAYYTGPGGEPLSSSLEPDTRVSTGARSFSDSQEAEEDMILVRGLEILLSLEPEPARKAA